MTREIKFRAWDMARGCFFKPTYEAYNGRLEDLSIEFSGKLLRRTLEINAEDESCFEGQYILMQYTGLKDRNGKEIYEGDIVTLPYENNKNLLQAVIEWSFSGWCFRWCNKRVSSTRGREIESVFHNIEFFEIIGNIYENPKLLGGEQIEA